MILPDDEMSWIQAATLPVSIQVPMSAWDALGLPRLGDSTSSSSAPQNGKSKSEALLIWGASSSVGTMGVQTARLLKADTNSSVGAVYASAGAANLEYVKSLGANRVFDHKDPSVVSNIISAAKEDELVIRQCFLATGQLAPCQEILKAFVETDGSNPSKGQIASSPLVPPGAAVIDGVEIIFLCPSMKEEERLEQ